MKLQLVFIVDEYLSKSSMYLLLVSTASDDIVEI